MGFHPGMMIRSERLAAAVLAYEARYPVGECYQTCYYQYGLNEDDAISRLEKVEKDLGDGLEFFDLTSTAGYDNDGSIGPDLVDNGIGLGVEAMRYDLKAVVFYAFGGNG